jgi:hypothetical protein
MEFANGVIELGVGLVNINVGMLSIVHLLWAIVGSYG